MKTKLGIKNFRVFDENGIAIELNPITILTGCNSSGKSSVVKAIFLLNSFLSQIKKDIENKNIIQLKEYKLDFTTYPNNLLGGFDKVIHSGSSTQRVTIEYSVYSLMLSKDVTVRLVFAPDANDELNSAYLHSITMSTSDGVFFCSSKENDGLFTGKGNIHNYNIIKDDCLDFLQIDFLINYFKIINDKYLREGNRFMTNEMFTKQKKEVFSILDHQNKSRLKDVVNHVFANYTSYGQPKHGNIALKKVQEGNVYDVIDWSINHDSLFMIPVLDRFDNVPKEKVWSIVEEIIKCDEAASLSIASRKIIDDFVSSDAKNIREYFGMYEQQFLNNTIEIENDWRCYYASCPDITNVDLGISQEYLNQYFEGPAKLEIESLQEQDSIIRDLEIDTPQEQDSVIRDLEIDTPQEQDSIIRDLEIDTPQEQDSIVHDLEIDTPQDSETEQKITFDYAIDFPVQGEIDLSYEDWKKKTIVFDMVYEILMEWNKLAGYDTEDNKLFFQLCKDPDEVPYYDHTMVKLFRTFVSELLEELVTPEWSGQMEYVSSSRASVKRLYPLDEDNDFTRLLKRYFEGRRNLAQKIGKENAYSEANSFIDNWVDRFEIGKSVSIIDFDGLGAQIRLHKTDEDKEGRLLADEGYGITQLVSVLLQIQTSIITAKETNQTNPFSRIKAFDKLVDKPHKYMGNVIAIEEPEIHLHPKFQSLLADMFLEAYEKYNIHFIIETHSEYLIRKSQVLVAQMGFETNLLSDTNSPFKTYYVPANGNPYSLGYRKDGKFADSFGSGFYDEATNLTFEIM